jgi:hypothetical protein
MGSEAIFIAHSNIYLELMDIPLNMGYQVKAMAKGHAYKKMIQPLVNEIPISKLVPLIYKELGTNQSQSE